MRAVTSARVSRGVAVVSGGRMRPHLDGHLREEEEEEENVRKGGEKKMGLNVFENATPGFKRMRRVGPK